MGSVYEACSDDSGHRVAVKLLSPKLATSRVSVERFRQEGRVASQINHPRCVFVLRADADAGWPFIVMELMPGKTLKDLVDLSGLLSPVDAITRILDVIEGLSEAHRMGVIHRDVKPSNCFITRDDRVKVGDFGLSKSLVSTGADGDHQLTQSGAFLGTILFAPPEQIRGEPVGYDSDIYAVCATLYFLLTGRAPHQHESATAAVAKVISEPVLPVRQLVPKVPAELDRIILRGLERERERRWQSLDDLHEVLRTLLPMNQRPARRRALVLAYTIDVLLLQLPALSLDWILHWQLLWPFWSSGVPVSIADFVVALVYFGVMDGIYGWTAGKRLVGLRVARLHEPGPPGIRAGVLRAALFHAVLFSALIGLAWVINPPDSDVSLRIIGAVIALTGLAGLGVQLRASRFGFRGLHDRVSRARTVQRPRPVHHRLLQSRYPNPLDQLQPSRTPLPAEMGGFSIRGKICDQPDGGELWLAEDRGLGRQVLIRIFAADRPLPDAADLPTTHPARLRPVGYGTIAWHGTERVWVAYVAPHGAPLCDVIDPAEPLSWAETRPILEQLTEELIAESNENRPIISPRVSQLWVEPGGRLQWLDFDIPTGYPYQHRLNNSVEQAMDSSDALRFIRQVATLTLEGQARSEGGPIHAPVPPQATAITERLFQKSSEGYSDLTAFRQDLQESHAHPAQVTASMRGAQLGAQAAMLAIGLMVMFHVTGLFTFGLAVFAAAQVWGPVDVRDAVADPARRQIVLARLRQLPPDDPVRQRLEPLLASPSAAETVERLDTWLQARQANLDLHRSRLIGIEQRMLNRLESVITEAQPDESSLDFRDNADIYLALAYGKREEPPIEFRKGAAMIAGMIVVAVPLIWAAFAFLFRGGLAMALAGITLVQQDGRLAGRWRCALRELVIWLPVTVLLLGSLWVQATLPDIRDLRVGLLLLALLLLPIYVLVALRNPERGPQDQILGTWLVPI